MSKRSIRSRHFSTCVETLEQRKLLSANLLADVGGFFPAESVEMGGRSYFAADDGVHGRELWSSDGTQDGTLLVKDIHHGKASSKISDMTVVSGQLFFFVHDSEGISLWRSSGTTAGTSKLATLPIGSNNGAPHPAIAGDKLVFAVQGGPEVNSVDLWASDGTAAGTHSIAHLTNYGETNSILPSFSNGNRALFIESGHHMMWSTDGTAAGTFRLSSPSSEDDGGWDGGTEDIHVLNGKFIFQYENTLWHSDGTVQGTQQILDGIDAGPGTLLGDRIVYIGRNVQHESVVIWSTDGTPNQKLVLGEVAGMLGSTVEVANGTVSFIVVSDQDPVTELFEHFQIWQTDGTADGTDWSPTKPLDGWLIKLVAVGDKAFYQFHQYDDATETSIWQVWAYDPSTDQFKLIDDAAQSGVNDIQELNGKLALLKGSFEEPVIDRLVDPASVDQPHAPVTGSARIVDGILRVYGTADADTIKIWRNVEGGDRIFVKINGVNHSFLLSDVKKIVVYSYAGDDHIRISESNGKIAVRSRIWAGAGDDVITTSAGRDSVYGEDGDDVLTTGRGDDMVDGGIGDDDVVTGIGNDIANGDAGSDSIFGGSGTDSLSGGIDTDEDFVDGGKGQDVVFGQAVYDIFFSPGNAGDTVLDDVLA